MRVLALDVGEKRIGVAVSDALSLTAQGVETIFTKGVKRDIERVKELAAKYETDRLLIGLPLNMSGGEGYQAAKAREFAEQMAAEGFSVKLWDERMSTISATRVLLEGNVSRKKRKDYVDKLAATYILQSFLDAGGWK